MKVQRVHSFKFVKGQTVFITEVEFFVSVRKMFVLEVLNNHFYEWRDPWGEEENEWHYGPAIRVMEDGSERILPIENFDLNTFVSTSSKNALKIVKTFSNKVSHFNLAANSYFVTEWT